jgi:hypothetical protein
VAARIVTVTVDHQRRRAVAAGLTLEQLHALDLIFR